ncbi:MAG: DUF484 family protein [Chromatiales bacterium]|jgi:uncharacterized protein YigA (DUF484 family)
MNQQITQSDEANTDLSEQDIVHYLGEHPDFFVKHPGLLARINIPHESGQAVSLIERQVEVLRNQLKEYQRRLEQWVEVAKQNDGLQIRMHRLTLELIDAATFDEVLTALEDELHDDFQADAVELRLFSASQLNDHLDQQLPNHSSTFEKFFKNNRPICGTLARGQLDYIFGAGGAEIASAALIPLKSEGVLGLLAIGSRDPKRFRSQQGTEFLTRLGEIISHTLKAVSLPGL